MKNLSASELICEKHNRRFHELQGSYLGRYLMIPSASGLVSGEIYKTPLAGALGRYPQVPSASGIIAGKIFTDSISF